MSNPCYNVIRFTCGSQEDYDDVVNYLWDEEKGYDFEKVVPYHDWGTRYIIGPLIGFGDNKIEFESAYVPALPITEELSKLFPHLVFSHCYDNYNEQFGGLFRCQNGVVISDETWSWDEYTEKWGETIIVADEFEEEMEQMREYWNRGEELPEHLRKLHEKIKKLQEIIDKNEHKKCYDDTWW